MVGHHLMGREKGRRGMPRRARAEQRIACEWPGQRTLVEGEAWVAEVRVQQPSQEARGMRSTNRDCCLPRGIPGRGEGGMRVSG